MKASARIGAVGIALVVLMTSAVLGHDADAATPRLWVIQGGWYFQLSDTERALFRSDPGVILGAVTASGRPTDAFAYPDLGWFRDIPIRDLETVMYDIEGWDATPYPQRRDPFDAIVRFAALAEQRGLRLIVAPHPSLVAVPGAVCGVRPGEPAHAAFLRCGILASAARVADVVEIQAQGLEADPGTYRLVVEAGARQIRGANPDCAVIAGLSIRPGEGADEVFAAWEAVSDIVDGYYLSIGGNEHVPEARRFLRMVLAATAAA